MIRWGRGYFEFNEPKPISRKEQKIIPEHNKNEPEPISGTDENEVAKSSSNFFIADLKHYDNNEKTIHYIQVNHVIEKPKNTETEENLKKIEFKPHD